MNIKNLEPILEYQKVDIELRKTIDKIERSDFAKKMVRARDEFNTAKEMVEQSEQNAEKVVSFYNKSINYFEENSKKIEELTKEFEELAEDNEDERQKIVLQLETVRNKLFELEKKLAEQRQKSDAVLRTYLEAQEQGKKARATFSSYKTQYDELKNEHESHIKDLNKSLSAMEKLIEKPFLENYKELTSERKFPAVVKATTADGGKSYSCGGCGLALSQKAQSELIESGLGRCETCRRFIYK